MLEQNFVKQIIVTYLGLLLFLRMFPEIVTAIYFTSLLYDSFISRKAVQLINTHLFNNEIIHQKRRTEKSLITHKKKCSGVLKNGKPCIYNVYDADEFCRIHTKEKNKE